MWSRASYYLSDKIRYTNRIFTNRNLRLESISAIGFDMDYTLAIYTEAVEELVARLALEKLVSEKNYPEHILSLKYDPDFPVRGLILDKRKGTIFKMDGHQHVQRAYHGFKKLNRSERKKAYRNTVIRPFLARYELMDTLFELPEMFLYASLVTWIDETKPKRERATWYAKAYDDLRAAIDRVHRDGSLKSVIMKDPDSFIVRDPELIQTLLDFRAVGKKLFLMTNSEWEYTHAVMTYLLGDVGPKSHSWMDLFDVVISYARKPAFFQEHEPFKQAFPVVGDDHTVSQLEAGKAYTGGNLRDFEKWTGWKGDAVLYVGDHIYGDVLRSKKTAGWRTALILPEMEAELSRIETAIPYLNERENLERARQRFEDELSFQRGLLRRLEEEKEGSERSMAAAVRTRIGILEEQVADNEQRKAVVNKRANRYFNPYWGRLFRSGTEHSSFGSQVSRYACLYTGRVSNFMAYPPTHYFQKPEERMAHERWDLY